MRWPEASKPRVRPLPSWTQAGNTTTSAFCSVTASSVTPGRTRSPAPAAANSHAEGTLSTCGAPDIASANAPSPSRSHSIAASTHHDPMTSPHTTWCPASGMVRMASIWNRSSRRSLRRNTAPSTDVIAATAPHRIAAIPHRPSRPCEA